jgi:basic membrane protein A
MEQKTAAIVVIVIILVAGVGAIVFLGPSLFPQAPSIAIVFATGGLGDKSFNDGCFEGAQQAKEELGANFTYVEPTATSEYEGYLRDFATHEGQDEPYDLIVGIGYDQYDAMSTVAEEYPEQKFAIIDTVVDLPNVASIVFEEHEGAALVGAIAGIVTDSDSVGFVGGMDIDLINKFAGGYVFGANYTNPGINYTIGYTNNWVDTAAGKALADTMYAAGTDIIFGAAGRSALGVFDSAKEQTGDKYVIGVDSPQMYYGTDDPENPEPPTVCITSMLKRVDIAVYSVIEDVMYGTFQGGANVFDLANGGLGYEINEDLFTLPQAAKDAAEDLRNKIVSGEINIDQYNTTYWE